MGVLRLFGWTGCLAAWLVMTPAVMAQEPSAGADSERTVVYDEPAITAAAGGWTHHTYIGRDPEDRPRVELTLVIPPEWRFEDDSLPIRVKGRCVHRATGFEVSVVTQVDEGHFCITHRWASVVREGEVDGVPYCVLELPEARRRSIEHGIDWNDDWETPKDVEAAIGPSLPPEGSTTVHYSFQIPGITGWLAAADILTAEQRQLLDSLVLEGLRVTFTEPSGVPHDR